MFFILGYLTFAVILVNGVYDGIQRFDYKHMIEPRLKIYLPTLYQILEGGLSDSLFFGLEEGYARKHNMLLDTLYFSGLAGLMMVFGIFICLIYVAKLIDSSLAHYRVNGIKATLPSPSSLFFLITWVTKI